jgi:hypothetical protein
MPFKNRIVVDNVKDEWFNAVWNAKDSANVLNKVRLEINGRNERV